MEAGVGGKRSILLVDDTARWHTIYKSALEEDLKCEVTLASGGSEALELLRASGPKDLVMLDLNMPTMRGDEVLQRLRADRQYDQMPIIIVTGDTASDTQERLLEAGANDFVDKGAPYGVLLARLRAQLRQLELQEQLTGIALDLDVFAAGILHDMHNLEHGLIAYGYLLDTKLDELPDGPDKMEMKSYVSALIEQLGRLSRYATDVIQTVRSGSAEQKLTKLTWEKSVDWVRTVVNSTQKGLGHPEVRILSPATWLATLGQPQLLNLVALNLVQNAVKYSRAGVPAVIEINQQREEVRGEQMIVTRFCDNGTGVAKEDLSKIFQPFVRAVETSSNQSKGFGLGLALVSKAVRSLGGSVWAELRNDQSHGAVFAVALKPSEL